MDSSIVFKLFSSNTVFILLPCVLLTLIMLLVEKKSKKNFSDEAFVKRAPGPMSLPILGNLYSMAGYELPYQSFGVLAKKFGDIINLKLGPQQAVVVNGIDNIKEVLIAKSSHFDSRPNFKRYHDLFSGNKENSLAFCNWSDIQKKRRDMLVQHSFPRNFSLRFNQLNDIIANQMQSTICDVKTKIADNQLIAIKPLMLQSCANIFTQYFCSRSFSTTDKGFQKMIYNFDKIFYEVNQGYLADFFPVLLPLFHSRNLKRMENWSHEIRQFILDNIIENRKDTWTASNEQSDYVDSLVDHVTQNLEPKMEWETALFALEDIIGGHSAVGNFLVKVFGYIVQNQHVLKKIQQEVDETIECKQGNSTIELSDRNQMPYTEAVIMEALRMIASPIVPHVANQNSTVGGYFVEKDTLIFLNNYELSMSEELWVNPKEFNPERFIRDGRVFKPDFFLPFGAGRRSCMGYKLVQYLSFSILTNLLQTFDVTTIDGGKITVEAGNLAVDEKSFEFKFKERC
ncbi:cytochrome P450 307a1-like [Bradysia coprophila]|uniref:cytochrome P450 307a1-like n=1 Tax=Bradysia coprophila TaxID=38358 RepID=UPI00187DD3F6|nr:cytochrome P450 307a1-like [Bradysia coprophila]